MSVKKTTDKLIEEVLGSLNPPDVDPEELAQKMMLGIKEVLKANSQDQFVIDGGKLQTAYVDLFGTLLINLYRLAEPEQKINLYVHLSKQIVVLLTHMKDGINNGKI